MQLLLLLGCSWPLCREVCRTVLLGSGVEVACSMRLSRHLLSLVLVGEMHRAHRHTMRSALHPVTDWCHPLMGWDPTCPARGLLSSAQDSPPAIMLSGFRCYKQLLAFDGWAVSHPAPTPFSVTCQLQLCMGQQRPCLETQQMSAVEMCHAASAVSFCHEFWPLSITRSATYQSRILLHHRNVLIADRHV